MTVAVDPTESIRILREIGAFAPALDFGLIEVYGVDAGKYLHAQTTSDVLSLPEGGSQTSCLLDRTGKVQAYFHLYRHHNSYRVVAERFQISKIIEHLRKFHFSEKIEILDLTNDGRFISIQGPRALAVVGEGAHPEHRSELATKQLIDLKLWGIPVHVLKKSTTGEPGIFVWCSIKDFDALLQHIEHAGREAGLVELLPDIQEIARIEAGLLLFGTDFDSTTFLLETGLDEFVVSYTKGCFQGQEVLARVKAQGAPAQGVIGVRFQTPVDDSLNTKRIDLLKGKDKVGTITSLCHSPSVGGGIAIAHVKREFRVPDSNLEVASHEGSPYSVRLQLLPFVQQLSAEQRAQQLYDRALAVYSEPGEAGEGGQSHEAIQLLRMAMELNPKFEDAYEILGVMLSKVDRLDEAIALMKKLVELNPDSVMAHANLSVFYVEKGMIEAAEEEKAISMSIRMKEAAQQFASEQEKAQERSRLREETESRLKMFKEVLALDPDDFLANYGVGSCAVDLEQYAEALEPLNKALKIKPTHTVAYVSLGAAYAGLGRLDEARQVYQNGIAVASKRGDMTPLKEMQLKLAALDNTGDAK